MAALSGSEAKAPGFAGGWLLSWPVIKGSIDESVMRVLRRKQDGLAGLWQAAE
jgi:hypothetical protein